MPKGFKAKFTLSSLKVT